MQSSIEKITYQPKQQSNKKWKVQKVIHYRDGSTRIKTLKKYKDMTAYDAENTVFLLERGKL